MVRRFINLPSLNVDRLFIAIMGYPNTKDVLFSLHGIANQIAKESSLSIGHADLW